jgi:2-polyprenyl-6-methoxyphenol hydroxylase-like FAD-dependent oxidoreductase
MPVFRMTTVPMDPTGARAEGHRRVLDAHHTRCCIVGAGPGGMMLALLLARRGVEVTLLESHTTFERDFRGDTIHPAILEILDQVGLADALHALPHVKMYGPALPSADGTSALLFDFRRLLKTRFPYIMWMEQERFLQYLANAAKTFPSLRLVMGANVQDLIEEHGRVVGVRYRVHGAAGDEWHEVRATLTVGADGRFSRIRKLAGIVPIQTSSPLELLWLRLPRLQDDPPGSGIVSPRFGNGRVMIMIDRADHWQIGYFIPAGEYQAWRAEGVEKMRENIVALEPMFAANVNDLTDWKQITLLSVASSRCRRWFKPGLLLIGDAAHTMSPAAGAGIKYAIEDAVVAANVLAAPLQSGRVDESQLALVQRQREWPTRVIQAIGAVGLRQISRLLRSGRRPSVPRAARLLFSTPLVAKAMAQMIAFGIRRVRVEG